MANEFQHKSVGSQLSQTEYEHTDGTGHVFDSQAAGDLAYASSSTVLSRLGIGTAGKVLMVNSGASAPEWQNAITGVTSILNTALVIGRDADNDIDFATDNNILFRAAGADQIKLIDGALAPVTDNDVDLGTSSLEFKDAFFDGTVTADAFAGPLTGNVTGNASGTAATVTGAAQSNITSLGTLTTLTVDNVITNGTTIGHTDDTDLMTLADGSLTLAGDLKLADGKNINLTTPLLAGADHTATGTTAQMLAGAAITACQLVCIHSTTQEVVPADASAAATSRAIGIALADIADTATGTILLHGFVRDDTFNFTTGGVVFLSETTGALTQTAPTTGDAFVQAVGIALEPDVVFINPSVDVIQHA